MRRFLKSYGLLVAVLLLFVVPAISEVVATIGGQDSSGNYAFTVDNNGVLDGADGSIIKSRVLTDIETISATTETVTSADSGKTYISTATQTTTFTLPDCGSTDMQIGFVDAYGKTITIDTYATTETIKYLTLDAGDSIDSAGATGDSIQLRCYTTDTWVPVEMGSSAWTDGGAS